MQENQQWLRCFPKVTICYFDTMSGWEEWLSMTPEEHWNWTTNVSQECIEIDWQHTGFFTYTRSDFETDTREEMLEALVKHFGL